MCFAAVPRIIGGLPRGSHRGSLPKIIRDFDGVVWKVLAERLQDDCTAVLEVFLRPALGDWDCRDNYCRICDSKS